MDGSWPALRLDGIASSEYESISRGIADVSSRDGVRTVCGTCLYNVVNNTVGDICGGRRAVVHAENMRFRRRCGPA